MSNVFEKYIGFFLYGMVWLPQTGYALSPIIQYQDLVAGEGEPGYVDGPFYSAQFNQPMGLALNADASVLYVADQQNNCIRAIRLEAQNEVETLAGTAQVGRQDGPLSIATFNKPSGLAALPEDQIAVIDHGNHSIRLINLRAKTVSTLAGGEGTQENIWNMAYDPSGSCLYFTQPEEGIFRKLDLPNGRIETVFRNNPLLPHPGPLCIVDGKIYIADSALNQVYEFFPAESKTTPSPTPMGSLGATPVPAADQPVSLQPLGQADHIIALAGMGKALYAYQANRQEPLRRVFPNNAPITFVSVWGNLLINPGPGELLIHFQNILPGVPAGFIADPRSQERFYLTNPLHSSVFSFRDLRSGELNYAASGEGLPNSASIHDFEYPAIKPPRTFRILLVGRSYLYYVAHDGKFERKGLEDEYVNYMTAMAKRLELSLNTRAALEDWPVHFEVLNAGMHHGSNELNLWSYYVVPPLVQKYDIDLTLIMEDPSLGLESYFVCPMTEEGIPSENVDPEYILKPNWEKFKSGPPHDFFELCKARKQLVEDSANKWHFPHMRDEMLSDPVLRKGFIALTGRPLELLGKKIFRMKTREGKACRLALCYFPLSQMGFTQAERAFWKDLCQLDGISFMDLSDDLRALGPTYYPYSATVGSDHFTADGTAFFNEVLIHELICDKMIPTAIEKN